MEPITITTENFDAEVLHSEKPVLLDFWASWCGPCRMLSPIVDEVAEERSDVKVGKVNVDEQPDLAAQFGVMHPHAAGLPERSARQSGGRRPPEERCAGPAGLLSRPPEESRFAPLCASCARRGIFALWGAVRLRNASSDLPVR